MVALEDWGEANELLLAFDASLAALKTATSAPAKQRKRPGITFLLNGYPSSGDSTAIWQDFESQIRAIASDSILRSIRWREGAAAHLSRTARNVCERVGLDPDENILASRALELRESDWAKTPYKDHLRRHAVRPRVPVREESKLATLYRESEAIVEFLVASEESDGSGGSASRRSRKARRIQLSEESLLPYIAPTRPYNAQEIALFVPSCVSEEYPIGRNRWARYVRGLRGSWVRVTSEDVAGTPPPTDFGSVGAIPPIWPIGVGNSYARSVTLGVSSLLTEYASWSRSAADQPDWSPDRYRRLANLVKQAVRGRPRPTHLLLPELSLPERWLGTISRLLSDANISLVAGLEYFHNGAEIHSDVALILSDNSLGYPSWIEIRQRKSEPAPDEEQRLLHDFGKIWAPGGAAKSVYNHKGFHLGVLVCSELQNINHRRNFQGNVDCLAVLSWNQDLETFSALVESAALDVHSYVALVNNRKYGDSRVRVPAKEAFNRDTCRIRGGENDYLVIIHLDLESLRAFQSRVKRWTRPGDPFKPVPEGFKMLNARKIVPR